MMESAVRTRLIRLCGLLTSDHDGEIVNAARKATKLLREHKLSWEEFINGKQSTRNDPPPPPPRPLHKRQAEWLLVNCQERLLNKEIAFVRDMLHWKRPSQKQQSWLNAIWKNQGGPVDF